MQSCSVHSINTEGVPVEASEREWVFEPPRELIRFLIRRQLRRRGGVTHWDCGADGGDYCALSELVETCAR